MRSVSIHCLWLPWLMVLFTATPSPATERLKLVVGGDHQNPPFEFLEQGAPTGFNVEVMRAVAQELGADVEFRLGPWAEVRSALELGKIDALAGMYYSEERSRRVDFTLPHTLVTMAVKGNYNKIYNKWFSIYENRDLWQTIRYYVWVSAVIAGLLAASSIWSWFLRREVRKRTTELRKSEERLRFTQYAVDNTGDQAFWMTEDSRFFYVNDAACRTLGYTREELLEMSVPDIDPTFPPDVFAKHWRDIRENGHATFESLHRAKDGHVYPVEIRANYVVFDGKGYNCAFANDISERKRTDEELRESEEKFRVLAETSPAAIYLYQGERFVYINPSSILLTGYSQQEFLQMNFWDFVHEDYRDLVKALNLARLRGEPVPSRYEIKIQSKSGEEKWVVLTAGHIDYRGIPAGIISMFDITGRKQMEEDLREARDDLENRIIERTAELRRANDLLEEEISVRKRTEMIITARLRLLEFAATHSLDELLEAAINEAEALTGSSIGFYHFLEPDQETLSLQNWSTRTKAEFGKAEWKGCHHDMSQGGVWTDCIRRRRPVIHNEYASLPHREGMLPDHVEIIRELALPVFRGDSIVAIIGVGNKPHDYTPEDIEAVSFLADLAWEIAERKQAEEALHLFRFCIDKAGVGIYQSDENGTIFSVNAHACNSLGYSKDELCSLTVFDIDTEITPERLLALKEILDETGITTHYSTHRRKNGSTFPVEITSNTIDFHGKIYDISFVKDITGRKRMEEELRESESRVKRKLESILDPEGTSET